MKHLSKKAFIAGLGLSLLPLLSWGQRVSVQGLQSQMEALKEIVVLLQKKTATGNVVDDTGTVIGEGVSFAGQPPIVIRLRTVNGFYTELDLESAALLNFFPSPLGSPKAFFSTADCTGNPLMPPVSYQDVAWAVLTSPGMPVNH